MKEKKLLYHITADIKDKRVDLYYYSIKQAKYLNPIAKNFKMEGVRHGSI